MEGATKKQNVWKRQLPGVPVFEEYHSVPTEEFAVKATEALRNFLLANYCASYEIQTHKTRATYSSVDVQTMSGDYVKVADNVIRPTKWGTDVDLLYRRPRFWLFDEDTLSEINLVCRI
jgi:hypothetical protein